MRQKAPDGAWSIGATAEHFNISPRAIRFYEEQGLLKLGRNGTHRTLGPEDRAALERLLLLRRMGFTVAEIRGLRQGMHDGQDALALPAPAVLREHLQRLVTGRAELDEAIALVQAALSGQLTNE